MTHDTHAPLAAAVIAAPGQLSCPAEGGVVSSDYCRFRLVSIGSLARFFPRRLKLDEFRRSASY